MIRDDNYKNARESMILENLPLVERVADKVFKSYSGIYERDDIVNIGVIGLMDAIEKYDPSRNASFETYAKWRIRGAIIDDMRSSGKLSRSKMDRVNQLYEALEVLQQKFSRRPSDQELMEYLQITSHQLGELYSAIHFLSSFSLESTVFTNADQEFTLMDLIEDQTADRPDETLMWEEQKDLLVWAIDQLKDREKTILNLIYFEDLPVKDIAEILGVSSSRISQLHGKLLTKIRMSIENVRGKES